ncbi:MAG: accessory gene regulator B family protein [Peptococcaceae bacterium]|nr:accessory gene regulator B family protein [Peptococcaceae bacterium]
MFRPARYISDYLARQLALDSDTREVLRYGSEIILLSICGAVLLVLGGWLLGCLVPTLAAAFTLFLIRTFAGGAHCTSALRCNLAGVIIFPALGKTAQVLHPLLNSLTLEFVLATGIPALIIVYRLSPVDSPAKPINTKAHRRRLKLMATFLAGAVLLFQLISLVCHLLDHTTIIATGVGLMSSALVLTSPGHKALGLVDRALRRVHL